MEQSRIHEMSFLAETTPKDEDISNLCTPFLLVFLELEEEEGLEDWPCTLAHVLAKGVHLHELQTNEYLVQAAPEAPYVAGTARVFGRKNPIQLTDWQGPATNRKGIFMLY